jgi:hypothetical protein
MSAIIVPLGLLLAVQGGGGLLNNLFSDSRSWFVLNYVEMPDWMRLGAYALMLVVGVGAIVLTKGWRWLIED